MPEPFDYSQYHVELPQHGVTECLIVQCTEKKNKVPVPVPAVDLYKGPIFAILRNNPPGIPVFVVSDKFGLVGIDTPLPYYDMPPMPFIYEPWVQWAIVDKWPELTEGQLDRFQIIWHAVTGNTLTCIKRLEKYGEIRGVVPEEVAKQIGGVQGVHGVRMHYFKEFCMSRQWYTQINWDAAGMIQYE